MKRIKLKSIIAGFVALVFAGIGTFSAFANVAPSLTVSPPTQKIILVPGETYNGSINVTNKHAAERNLEFSVFVGSFNQSVDNNGNYGEVDIKERSNYNIMVDWIKIGKESGSVEPNETVAVPYSIEVPKDAPAGGQYATIVVKDESGSADFSGSGADVKNVFQIAATIYAEVAGDTRDTGEIIENNAPSFLLDGSKFEATSMVKNTGNVHIDAEYTLQVWPLFSGEEICTNEENPDKSLILPETQRYHAQKCELPSFGIFNIKQTVKIFDQVSTIEKMVIVCPIWLLFLILFIVALGVIYLFAKSKKRKND